MELCEVGSDPNCQARTARQGTSRVSITPPASVKCMTLSDQNPDLRSPFATADQLLGRGLFQEAVLRYREALQVFPQATDAWFNLGYALRRQGAYRDALDAYAEALKRGGRNAEQIHLNRAVIFTDFLLDDAAAEHELQSALAVSPRFEPARLNLGNLYEERGLREQAADCYRSLTAAGSGSPYSLEALARLVHLHPPTSPADQILLDLRNAAENRKDIDDVLRANLFFALGQALDHLGHYADAFRAYSAAKSWSHRRLPYDPIKTEKEVDALVDCFPGVMSDLRSHGESGFQPLFICGMFRSGSTLLEQVLCGHPAVAAGGELDLLPRIAHRLSPFPFAASTINEPAASRLASEYIAGLKERVRTDEHGTRFVTDKRPDNYRLIGLIKRMFPAARIVHTVRHPFDNALSVFTQHLNPRQFPYAGSLAGIGHNFVQYRRLMAHWKRLYPEDIYDFDYDAFVAAPEGTLRGLLDFLDLPWHHDCLQFQQRENTVRTASYWQVRQPLHAKSSGRWHNYLPELEPLLAFFRQAGIDAGP